MSGYFCSDEISEMTKRLTAQEIKDLRAKARKKLRQAKQEIIKTPFSERAQRYFGTSYGIKQAGGNTMQKRERCPYAGCTLKTRPDVGDNPINGQPLGNLDFEVEDWFENVAGRSWMFADGNPTALIYAFRTGKKGNVPTDNDVVYGKIDGLGYAFHVSELVAETA